MFGYPRILLALLLIGPLTGCPGELALDPLDDDALIEFHINSTGVHTIIATSAGSWETGDSEIEIW
ncbi:MAG: hypothetical protein QGH45_08225 [Myxococcota bacterium]|jgi:hypothetical protein|nr:hypothetical protein [Myxococcota bacterium]